MLLAITLRLHLHGFFPLQPPLSLLMRDILDDLSIPSDTLDTPRLLLQTIDRGGFPYEGKHPGFLGGEVGEPEMHEKAG